MIFFPVTGQAMPLPNLLDNGTMSNNIRVLTGPGKKLTQGVATIMQKSGEDYLEAVLAIEEQGGKVRITDVALRLGVTKPSVSRAMKVLQADGYIHQETYGDISLTQKGRVKASQVYTRHKTLTSFLADVLGVSPDVAEQDACLIEHDISAETMERLAAIMAGRE